MLHRDIKPNNVFLMDSKKIIQLGDFGLAKVINDGDKQVKAEVRRTQQESSPTLAVIVNIGCISGRILVRSGCMDMEVTTRTPYTPPPSRRSTSRTRFLRRPPAVPYTAHGQT